MARADLVRFTRRAGGVGATLFAAWIHGCGDGGTTSAGTTSSSPGTGGAGPVGVVVTAAGHPGALAVDASGLYWSDTVTGDLQKAALDGSGVTTLAAAPVAPGDLRGLALGPNDVDLSTSSQR